MQAKYPFRDFFFPGNETSRIIATRILIAGRRTNNPQRRNLAADHELVKKMRPDVCEQFCSITGKATGVILLSCLLKSRVTTQRHADSLLHRLFHRRAEFVLLVRRARAEYSPTQMGGKHTCCDSRFED